MSDALAAAAVLGEPLRRRLYDIAGAHADGVTRDLAARLAGVPRHVAAYHLDQLARGGLLDVAQRRQGDRRGPGAGRPAKVYRRAAQPVDVSLPPRNYRLASRLLLDAVPSPRALVESARRRGVEMGAAAREGTAPAGLDALLGVLRDNGFEPVREGGKVRLRNCAFHELAEQDRDTVCAMNLGLMRGLVEGMGIAGVSAEQRPPAPGCCVAFTAH